MDNLQEISKEEFKESGMLWLINQQLHLFGLALVLETIGGKTRLYPAKCKFRGFDESTNLEGYRKVSEYMEKNAKDLIKDCLE